MEVEHRYRAFHLIAAFPEIYDQLSDPTKAVLQQCVAAAGANPPDDLSFVLASSIADLRPSILRVVATLSEQDLTNAVAVGPPMILWQPALAKFSQAGGYRSAEDRFRRLISPFAGLLGRKEVESLLETITGNEQIYFAADIPSLLKRFMENQPENSRPSTEAWNTFYRDVRGYRNWYEDLWLMLEEEGWARPALRERAD